MFAVLSGHWGKVWERGTHSMIDSLLLLPLHSQCGVSLIGVRCWHFLYDRCKWLIAVALTTRFNSRIVNKIHIFIYIEVHLVHMQSISGLELLLNFCLGWLVAHRTNTRSPQAYWSWRSSLLFGSFQVVSVGLFVSLGSSGLPRCFPHGPSLIINCLKSSNDLPGTSTRK